MRRGALLMAMLLAAACSGQGTGGEESRAERISEMYAGYRSEFPLVGDIDVAELRADLEGQSPPVLVDVRTEEERAVSLIPGAISKEEFESRRGELSGRSVVTYCTIGYRSGLYADELRRQGWEVRNLAGSILAWTHGGGELEHDGRPTRRVHVYGKRWDLAADDFESVW